MKTINASPFLLAEQVAMVFRQFLPGQAVTGISVFILVAVLWGHVADAWLLAWVAGMAVVFLGRVALLSAYRRAKPQEADVPRWGRRFVVGTGLAGLMWGSAGFALFPEQDAPRQIFLVIQLAGMTAGGMTSLAAVPPAFAVFTLGAMLPLALRLFLLGQVYAVIGLMCLIFAVGMLLMGRNLGASIREALQLRFDNLSLIRELEKENQSRLHMELALRESEGLFRALAENTSSGIFTLVGSKFHYMNPAGARMSGYSMDELLTMDFPDLVAPNYRELVVQRHMARLQGQELPPRYEIAILTKAGERRWLDLSASLITLNGSPAVVATAIDVSERKAAEQALRQSEARANQILDTAPEAMLLVDAAGSILRANRAAEQVFGYGAGDLLGLKVEALIPERLRKAHQGLRTGFLKRPQSRQLGKGFRLLGQHRDGSEFPVDVSLGPLDMDGQPHVIVGVVDVTERMKAEDALRDAHKALEAHKADLEQEVARRTAELREAEANARLILESSASGLFGMDREGRVSFINPAACDVLGYTSEQLIGKPVHATIHHSHRDGTPYSEQDCPTLSSLLEGRLDQVDDEVYWHADGHAIPVIYTSHPIRQGTAIVGAVVSFLDNTQRKAAEDAREQARRAAERLAQAKSEFLSNMSHEIRTPLNAILGLAQVGARETAGQKVEGTFLHILDSGQLLLGVINDVLDYSKIEAGKLSLEQEPVILPALIERAGRMVSERALARGLEFHVERAPSLPAACLGDELRLSQVLINLLINAVKFTEKGRVTLAAECRDGKIVFRISDTGIGMSKEQLARLFQPFEQADGSTTRRFGGTGLGLSITKRLVDLMKGEIRVDSEEGKGSSFEVLLPLPETVLPAIAEASTGSDSQSGKNPRLVGISILAAEDNEVNRLVLEELLGFEGAQLTCVENGRLLVECVERTGPAGWDIVLTDVQMPEMDGYDAARRIHAFAPTLPIIGLTAYALPEERERCLAAGMGDHVTKPVDIHLLVAAILRLVHRKHGPRGPALHATPQVEAAPAAGLLDYAALSERYKNKQAFLKALLAMVKESEAGTPDKLRDAARREDWQALHFLAHSVKGMAGNIMAPALHQEAMAADMAARESRPEALQLGRNLAVSLEALLTELERYDSTQ